MGGEGCRDVLEKTIMCLVINFKATQLWNEMSLMKFKYHLEMRKIISGIDCAGLEVPKPSLSDRNRDKGAVHGCWYPMGTSSRARASKS